MKTFASLAFVVVLLLTSPIHAQDTNGQLLPGTADTLDCSALQMSVYALAQGDSYQKMYDTALFAIEHCATATGLPHPIWIDFGAATSGCQYKSEDKGRWPPYREWLKKVLYYRSDSLYYCADVHAIYSSLQYFNADRGYDINGQLAILKFLKDSNRCLSIFDPYDDILRAVLRERYQVYRDSVRDTVKTPYSQDTTVPSLEDLDLQILRGPQYRAVSDAFSASHAGPKITFLSADENPFDRQTTLRFGLVDAEYMRIDIYDPLGKHLYTDTRLCSEGNNRWMVSGQSLPHGTLYARVSTMSGDVRTVKLIRQ
ncbi:MAG: hypothetical protein JSS75_08020 [Bacteroidetes bacterium]|nr:hypothetical protein [Bacteroidota bacterium]